jgi:C2H2-type zinc finger
METTHCPVCAATIPAATLEDHVETIHPSVVDTEVTEARASAHHTCPFCGRGFATPEDLKDHIGHHGR